MASLPLLYVHGAGPQPPASTLKTQLDAILFGQDAATTRVAYYADVRWGRTSASRGAAAAVAGAIEQGCAPASDPCRPHRTRRRRPRPPTRSSQRPSEPARRRREAPAARTRGVAAGVPSPDRDRAGRRRRPGGSSSASIDKPTSSPSRSSVPATGVAAGITFPDPIFRIVVGRFASDVVDYLYGPYAEAMREPVRQALLARARRRRSSSRTVSARSSCTTS